eukprot:m.231830 g.231830  ORF g.231830 m.231830 type:complete len:238 (+) comp54280_c0_seq6:400-1113(+)
MQSVISARAKQSVSCRLLRACVFQCSSASAALAWGCVQLHNWFLLLQFLPLQRRQHTAYTIPCSPSPRLSSRSAPPPSASCSRKTLFLGAIVSPSDGVTSWPAQLCRIFWMLQAGVYDDPRWTLKAMLTFVSQEQARQAPFGQSSVRFVQRKARTSNPAPNSYKTEQLPSYSVAGKSFASVNVYSPAAFGRIEMRDSGLVSKRAGSLPGASQYHNATKPDERRSAPVKRDAIYFVQD